MTGKLINDFELCIIFPRQMLCILKADNGNSGGSPTSINVNVNFSLFPNK